MRTIFGGTMMKVAFKRSTMSPGHTSKVTRDFASFVVVVVVVVRVCVYVCVCACA